MRRALPVAFALVLLAGMAGAAPPAGGGDFSACEATYAAIGLPRMKSAGDVAPIALCRAGYAVQFNPNTRVPDWVIERLPAARLTGNAKRKNNFHLDPDANAIVAGSSANPEDYTGQHDANGVQYDRGHQAPADDFKSSQPLTDQSFLMTNMAPQIGPSFNEGIWKVLETDVRRWVLCGGMPELYVITGPIYTSDTVRWIAGDKKHTDHKVRVPDAFFKVIYDPKHKRALGMELLNAKAPSSDLPKFAVAISQIEEETGITFFPKLSKRDQNLMKTSVGNLWGSDSSCNTGD